MELLINEEQIWNFEKEKGILNNEFKQELLDYLKNEFSATHDEFSTEAEPT